MRWGSRSQRKILTPSFWSMHSFGQQRRAYSHTVRWLSRDRNSPIQSHPVSLLLHMTLSDLISCSATGRNLVLRYVACPLVHQKFIYLGCQESLVLFSCSLGMSRNVSCVDSGRHCSRPSHSMSLGVDCGPQVGRSDRSTCLVVCPQTCSHIRQCCEH